jgi:hypothetical protein
MSEPETNLRIYYQILCGCLGGLDESEERRAVAGLMVKIGKALGWASL